MYSKHPVCYINDEHRQYPQFGELGEPPLRSCVGQKMVRLIRTSWHKIPGVSSKCHWLNWSRLLHLLNILAFKIKISSNNYVNGFNLRLMIPRLPSNPPTPRNIPSALMQDEVIGWLHICLVLIGVTLLSSIFHTVK